MHGEAILGLEGLNPKHERKKMADTKRGMVRVELLLLNGRKQVIERPFADPHNQTEGSHWYSAQKVSEAVELDIRHALFDYFMKNYPPLKDDEE